MLVAENLQYRRVYYTSGMQKVLSGASAIKDPPTNGFQNAFVLVGEKRSTVFCPYTFDSWSVPNSCYELSGRRADRQIDWRPDFTRDLIYRNWAEFQKHGYQKDYDTCVLVLKRLEWEVPEYVETGGGEAKKKGGKEVDSKLLKPVKASGKRGKFLKYFLDNGGTRSVREAMAEFGMTRSNALSYLYMLRKDHGIGYDLTGETVTVQLPDGCDNPFE